MKINHIKQPGGVLVPASDMEADRMSRFKSGEMYEVDIKLTRNPGFHRKVFLFFGFCFEHWKGGNEYQDEAGQFNLFRKEMTALAGYRDEFFRIDGSVRVEAKSLAYANMDQDEFEAVYSALINVALRVIFKDADENTEARLLGFF